MKASTIMDRNALKLSKIQRYYMIILTIIIIIIGGFYLNYIWNYNVTKIEQRANDVAESFIASLDREKLIQLTATEADIFSPAYQSIKSQLQEFVKINEKVAFSYLYTYQSTVFKFMVDSEPPSSPDYSPPGQLYYEASLDDYQAFNTGQQILTKPTSDRWGTWISILIPIKDPLTNQVLMIYGSDYDAEAFYGEALDQTIIAGIMYGLLVLVVGGFYHLSFINYRIKHNQELLQQAYNDQEQLFTQMRQGFALHEILVDDQGKGYDYRYLKVNQAFCQMLSCTAEQLLGHTIKELFPTTETYWIENFIAVAQNGQPKVLENYFASTGHYYEVSVYSPMPNQFAVIVTNITDRKKQEQEIIYLNNHDQLTGFYNRYHFITNYHTFTKAENFPLGLIVSDINALKLTNEAFGRSVGDDWIKSAAIMMQTHLRSQDVAFKWDGDEFLILLPHVNEAYLVNYVTQTKKIINQTSLSLSFGYALVDDAQAIEQGLNNAENMMLSNKTYESESFRGQTIKLILKTLNEKNPREEQHSRRVSELCGQISQALQLSINEINMMKMVGLIHDIGKIGIDENVLNKPGKLTAEEFSEIKKHSEIGYRILSETNETSLLAKYILSHHERLDGSGYPFGISGDEIPLYTRILSIADAYDAMTSQRTYRQSLTKAEAIEELYRFSGTQFDETIVKIFVSMVLNQVAVDTQTNTKGED